MPFSGSPKGLDSRGTFTGLDSRCPPSGSPEGLESRGTFTTSRIHGNLHLHKEPWNMKGERQEEATNPIPEEAVASGAKSECDFNDFETINTTSARTKQQTLLKRVAHITAVQEHCLTPAQIKRLQIAAAKEGKRIEGRPLDPEHGRTSAGVGIFTLEGLIPYPIPNPSKNYQDAVDTGICGIYCMDLGGTTHAIAIVYGWTGGGEGSSAAARTDDLLTIVQTELAALP